MTRSPISLTQRILVSTRLRRWYPLQRFQIARPSRCVARKISLRALAPGRFSFQGLLAFFLTGMMAWAARRAIAS